MYHAQLFHVSSWDQLGSFLMLAGQVLYCLPYLPSPDIWSLKFENPTPTGQSVTLWRGQSLDSQT